MSTTPNPTPSRTEGFRYDPTTRTVSRESDGEIMANVSAAGILTFTHQSREKNYGTDIRALLAAASVELAEPGKTPETPPATATPVVPPAVEPTADGRSAAENEPEPERHPVLGAYSVDHLLWDWLNRDEKQFLAKWGGPLTLSTKRTVQEHAELFDGIADDIADALDDALENAPNPNDLDEVIRERVVRFMENAPAANSQDEAVGVFTTFVTDILRDPAIRTLLP